MRSSIPDLIGSNHGLLGLAGVFLTVTWLLFYVFSLYRGARDQSFGAPVLAVTLLWSHDLVFSFLNPSEETPARALWLLWLSLDSLLLWQAFLFGSKAYPDQLQRRFASLVTGGTWIASLCVVLSFISYYELFSGYLIGLMVEGALALTLLLRALDQPSGSDLSLAAQISRFGADVLGALVTWTTLPFVRDFESLELAGGGNNPASLFLFALMLATDGGLLVVLLCRVPDDSG